MLSVDGLRPNILLPAHRLVDCAMGIGESGWELAVSQRFSGDSTKARSDLRQPARDSSRAQHGHMKAESMPHQVNRLREVRIISDDSSGIEVSLVRIGDKIGSKIYI